MTVAQKRKTAQILLAGASTAIIVGGITIALGWADLGDGEMIVGAAMLILGTFLLVRIPTGDNDAG